MIEILRDPNIGPKRLGKCDLCGKHFIARKKSGGQRFCNSKRNGQKSMCAIKWHIKHRAEPDVATRKDQAEYMKSYRAIVKRGKAKPIKRAKDNG